MSRWPFLVLLVPLVLLPSLSLAVDGAASSRAAPRPPRPPEQPATGPGGAAFAFEGVSATRVGRVPDGAWVFEPTDLRLDEETALGAPVPVVVFLHGFTAVDPAPYRAWIDHVVRRGAVVIYPDYQTLRPFEVGFEAFFPNALAGIRAGLAELAATARTRPDLSRVAVVGHSLGAVLAANYAATAAGSGLPVPSVLMAVEPGGCDGCGQLRPGSGVALEDLGQVGAATRALVVVGEDDNVVGETGAELIWSGLSNVPLDQRDYVTVPSDHRGLPPLRATHLMPQTAGLGGNLDALDWYGTWKWLDALMSCAFAGEECGSALGDTPEQRSLGLWSDGEPVTEARVTDAP